MIWSCRELFALRQTDRDVSKCGFRVDDNTVWTYSVVDCTRWLTTLVNLFTPGIASKTVLHDMHALLAVARPVRTALPRAERHVRPNWLFKATPLSMLLLGSRPLHIRLLQTSPG